MSGQLRVGTATLREAEASLRAVAQEFYDAEARGDADPEGDARRTAGATLDLRSRNPQRFTTTRKIAVVMPGILQSYAMGVPTGWIAWDVGQGSECADELTAKAADSPGAQEVVRRAVLALDRLCQTGEGLFVRAGLWVPVPGTGEVAATAQLELRTGPPDQDASFSEQLEQAKSFTTQRGFKIFDRAVEPMTVQAGPAIGEVTVLAERSGRLLARLAGPELVQARVEITVFPPGSSEVLCLHAITSQVDLLEALGQEARAMVESLTVVVGPPSEV